MNKTNIATPTTAPIRPMVSHHLAAAFGIFFVAVIGFSVIAYQVRGGLTLPFDRAILWWIHDNVPAQISNSVIAVTDIGGPVGTVVLAGGLMVILWLKRRRYAALALAAGVGGAAAMNLVLKYLFERTRPDLWTRLVHETSFSFPSGHAMASSALAFSLIVIFWRTRWRCWIIAAGVLYMVTIGFTRLYLGVHYPTDIIGGWVVSMGWVAIVAAVISEYINRRQRLNDAA